MHRAGNTRVAASACVALGALALAVLAPGMHRLDDPFVPHPATAIHVLAAEHPVDPSNHLDSMPTGETALCPACLQQLQQRTLLPAPQVGSLTLLAAPALDGAGAPPVGTPSHGLFSSRAPPLA
jgi:hypothetical protein